MLGESRGEGLTKNRLESSESVSPYDRHPHFGVLGVPKPKTAQALRIPAGYRHIQPVPRVREGD